MGFFPDLYVPESGKTQEWCERVLKAISQYSIKSTAFRNERIKDFKNYDMFKGTYDLKAFDYITNQFGVVAPARLVHYPWINTRVNELVGQFLQTPLQFSVVLTSDEGKERKLQKASRVGAELLTRKYRKPIEDSVGQPLGDEGVQAQLPDDLEDSLNMTEKDEVEEFNYYAIKYLIERHELMQKFKRGLYDMCICSKEFYYTDVVNGEPVAERCDPRSILYDVDTTAEDIEDAAWVAHEKFLTPNQIIDEYKEYFKTEKELEGLKEITQSTIGEIIETNPEYGSMYHVDKQGGVRIRVIHGCWNGLKLRRVKLSPNPYDETDPFIKLLPDDYVEKKGDVIEKRFYNDVWEGVMIGHSMFIKCKRRFNQPRRQEWGYAKTKLPYIGGIKGGYDGLTVSVVDSLFNLALFYDVIMFHIDLTLSRSAGKAVVYDIAQKPKQYTFAETIGFAKNSGIIPIDTSRDGNRGSQFNQFQQIDFTLSNQMTQLINLKAEIERTAEDISGLSRVRMGNMQASDGAHNTQASITQSNTITLPIYYAHNRVMNRVLNQLGDLIKYSKWKQGDRLSYIMDDGKIKMNSVPKDFDNDDIGVFMEVGTIEMDKKAQQMQLAQQALSTKSIDFMSILDMIHADSATEGREIFKKGLKVIQDQQQQMAQYQQQKDQAEMQLRSQQGNASIEASKIKAEATVVAANIAAGNDKDMQALDQEFQRELIPVQGAQKIDQMAFDQMNQEQEEARQGTPPPPPQQAPQDVNNL